MAVNQKIPEELAKVPLQESEAEIEVKVTEVKVKVMESREELCRNQRTETEEDETSPLKASQNRAEDTGGSVPLVLVLTIAGAMFGAVEFGYNTGVINAPQMVIEEFINSTITARSSAPPESQVTLIWSFIVAVFAVGGMLGGSVAGWWAERFGRKWGLLYNNASGLLASLLMGLAQISKSFEMIIVGRLLVGFCSAIFTGLTPMYLTEVAPPHLRGALGTVNQLGVTIGLLVSQVLGIADVLGSEEGWAILLGLSALPCVLVLILLPWCPESPRYLVITQHREKDARRELERLRGHKNVDEEVEEMKLEATKQSGVAEMGIFQLLRTRSLHKPLLICVVMQLSQQFSGINAVFYYSTGIFVNAGLTKEVAGYATIGVGGIMVVMTLVSIPLMDRAGRRTLHLLGLGGMFVFSIGITVGLFLKDQVGWFSYVTVISALMFVVFFAIGPGSIPWMITAEMFSQGPRSAAISIAIVVNWTSNFIIGLGFLKLEEALGNFTFIPFTVLLLVFWLFTYFLVPETKNRTIDQITSMFQASESRAVNSPPEV